MPLPNMQCALALTYSWPPTQHNAAVVTRQSRMRHLSELQSGVEGERHVVYDATVCKAGDHMTAVHSRDMSSRIYPVLREVLSVINRLSNHAASSGNLLANLLPGRPRDWWPIIEDVFSSPAVSSSQRLGSDCVTCACTVDTMHVGLAMWTVT